MPQIIQQLESQGAQEKAGGGNPSATASSASDASLDSVPLMSAGLPSRALLQRQRRGFMAALAVAFSLHAGFFIALFAPQPRFAGGGGTELDAISITLVDSDVLQALNPDNDLKVTGAMAAPGRAGSNTSTNSSTQDTASATGKP